jgi:hypothetical protein
MSVTDSFSGTKDSSKQRLNPKNNMGWKCRIYWRE